jgi:alkylation response protein AidB-like acyl-CoA dehydrogenase
MTMATLIEEMTWVEKARELAALVDAYTDDAEEERRLPGAVFEALREAGVFNLLRPPSLGGAGADFRSAIDVIEELSRQSGSVGWNAMIGTLSGLLAAYLPAAAAEEVYGRPENVVAGSFAPTGKAVAVEGGYRLSGRWQFASGCENASWMVCGAIVTSPGGDADPASPPDVRLFFLPKADCEIVDTWFTTGMRGTGSQDFIVEEVFIPERRQFPFARLQTGPDVEIPTAYSQPFYAIASPLMAVVALGIARRAIDAFKDLAMRKTPRAGTTTLANQHTIHERVGMAEGLVRSARAYLHDTVREVVASEHLNGEAKTETVAMARLAGAISARSAVEAVDLMYEAGGGSSIYASSPLERCFRDAHMVTHHIAVAPSNIEMCGQYLLGLGLQVRR